MASENDKKYENRLKSMKAEPRLACNLECIGDLESEHVQEYCGPVKIVVVQKPEDRYIMRKWSTACYAYANICIGGMSLATSIHDSVRTDVSLKSKAHAIFGLYGLLFFSSFGMMNMNFDYGASFNMKDKQMQREHLLLHLVGLLLSTVSWVFSFTLADEEGNKSKHGATCRLALICGAIALGLGLFFSRIFRGTRKIALHALCGTVAYFFYCVCAVTGEHGHWPAFPNEKHNYYIEAFTVILVLAGLIILTTSVLFIIDLCRQASDKARPACLDEKQLKKDRKTRKLARKEERKRRDLIKSMGQKPIKKYEEEVKK